MFPGCFEGAGAELIHYEVIMSGVVAAVRRGLDNFRGLQGGPGAPGYCD